MSVWWPGSNVAKTRPTCKCRVPATLGLGQASKLGDTRTERRSDLEMLRLGAGFEGSRSQDWTSRENAGCLAHRKTDIDMRVWSGSRMSDKETLCDVSKRNRDGHGRTMFCVVS